MNARAESLERYLSTEELADYLGVTVSVVRAWRHKGIGPVATKVGRRVRYGESDIVAWLNARREADGDDSRLVDRDQPSNPPAREPKPTRRGEKVRRPMSRRPRS